MTRAKMAAAEHAREVVRSARENDGWPSEADAGVNDSARAVVVAIEADHGQAWIGKINRARDERDGSPIRRWDGSPVLNFEADFVVPVFDQALEDLLLARERAGWVGQADYAQIKAIHARIEAIGGRTLVWT